MYVPNMIEIQPYSLQMEGAPGFFRLLLLNHLARGFEAIRTGWSINDRTILNCSHF